MKKGIIRILKYLAFLAIGIVLLWLAFRKIKFIDLAEGLKDANYSWVILSGLFSLFAYFSRARRWILLIHSLGYKPSLRNSFYALMTGYLANLALPRIGEVSRCVALGRKEKIPVDQLIGTVIIERTIDLLSLLSIMVIMIFVMGDAMSLFLKDSIFIPIQQKFSSSLSFTVIFWVIIILLVFSPIILLIKFKEKLQKISFFAKMIGMAKGINNGFKTITNLHRKWEFIFHTVFIWLNYILMTWVVVFSLQSTSHLNLAAGIFLLVIGGLAMSAPVQSGLGVFHYTISRGLLVVYGIKIEDGLVYALLSHESQMILIVILGAISFFALFGKHRKEEIS